MQHCNNQYSAVQYSTEQFNAVQGNTEENSAVLTSVQAFLPVTALQEPYGATQLPYSHTVQYSTVQYSTVQYHMTEEHGYGIKCSKFKKF